MRLPRSSFFASLVAIYYIDAKKNMLGWDKLKVQTVARVLLPHLKKLPNQMFANKLYCSKQLRVAAEDHLLRILDKAPQVDAAKREKSAAIVDSYCVRAISGEGRQQVKNTKRPAKDRVGARGPAIAWEPDSAACVCRACAAPFTMLKRRHHCRCCGLIFCFKCSPRRQLDIYGTSVPIRTCNACWKINNIVD